jgi:hypothetical protein
MCLHYGQTLFIQKIQKTPNVGGASGLWGINIHFLRRAKRNKPLADAPVLRFLPAPDIGKTGAPYFPGRFDHILTGDPGQYHPNIALIFLEGGV